ncbi:MAG: isocitrate lyase/phosphoenolpyruvate mutase family protein [Thalassobaculaceae bacterium]|nr:isocitrate lyase/phosphoenolpyruvate mutase family protein [Thalassobaculaceae bacterium]
MTQPHSLKDLVARKGILQAMSTHSPISAKLAEEAGFDALWGSGFELSALYGLPDVSLITMTQHLDMVRAIVEQSGLPMIADIDTGFGNAVNVDHAVRAYERAGVAAVVIEDKSFPKVTSLIEGGRQEMVRIEEFQGKIEAARGARRDDRFTIIARTEALIAGLGQEEALRRAHAYVEAGADMILVHSKSTSPEEISAFIDAWDGSRPIVLVPTSYPEMTVERMRATGKVGIAIWGNHAMRAAVTAMQRVFRQILDDGGIHNADREIVPVAEVFRLQDMDEVKRLETDYLR